MKRKRARAELAPADVGTKRATRNRVRQQDIENAAPSRVESQSALKGCTFDGYCVDARRNPDCPSKDPDPALEESLLAFSDALGVRGPAEDIEEDKLMFLEVTFSRCGTQADAAIPSQKMFTAVFHQAQNSHSAELTTATFQLLEDLEKRHPQVAVKERWDESVGKITRKLDVDKRVWSPLEQTIYEERSRLPAERSELARVPLNLYTLVRNIAKEIGGRACHYQATRTNGVDYVCILGHFLMLQHLINLIQRDLYCRLQVYEETLDASLVPESYFYKLFCRCPQDLRNAFFDKLVFILRPNEQRNEEKKQGDRHEHVTHPVDNAILREKSGPLPSWIDFSHLAYRLLLMVIQVDWLNRRSNLFDSKSTRMCSFPDICRIFIEAKKLEAFLQAIGCPWTKLRFILDYFVASAPKAIIAKGLGDPVDYATMAKLMSCFEGGIRKFIFKFPQDVLPSLLGHAFQAFLIVHAEDVVTAEKDERGIKNSKLLGVCQSLVDTLNELRERERQTEMVAIAEHVLQIATTKLNDSKLNLLN